MVSHSLLYSQDGICRIRASRTSVSIKDGTKTRSSRARAAPAPAGPGPRPFALQLNSLPRYSNSLRKQPLEILTTKP